MGNLVSQDYSLESLLQQGTSNLFLSPTTPSISSSNTRLETDSENDQLNSKFEYNESLIRDTAILHVMEFCEVETLVQFSKTCKLIYEVQEMYKSQIWRLNFIRHSMASNSFKLELLQEQQQHQQQKEEQQLQLQNTSLDEFFLASPTANAHGGFFDLENWKEKCLNYISIKRKLLGKLEPIILQRLNEQDIAKQSSSCLISSTSQQSSSISQPIPKTNQGTNARSNSITSNTSSSPPNSNSPIVSSPKGSFTLNTSHTRTFSKLYTANSTLISSPRNASKPSITSIFGNTAKANSTSPTLQPTQPTPSKLPQTNPLLNQIDSKNTPLHIDIKADTESDDDSWNLSDNESKKSKSIITKSSETTPISNSVTPSTPIGVNILKPAPKKSTKDTDSWGVSDDENEKEDKKKTIVSPSQNSPISLTKTPLSIPTASKQMSTQNISRAKEDRELDEDEDEKTDSWADIEDDDTVVGVDVDQTGINAPKMMLDVAPSLPTIKSPNSTSTTKKKTDTDDDDWGLSEEEKSPRAKPKIEDKKPAKKVTKDDDSWGDSDTEEESKKPIISKKPLLPSTTTNPKTQTTPSTATNVNTNTNNNLKSIATTNNSTTTATLTATPTPVTSSLRNKSKVNLHHLINILCDEDLTRKHYFSIDKQSTLSFYQEILDLSQQLFASNTTIEKLPQLKEDDLQFLKDGLFYKEVFGHGIQIKWILLEAVLPAQTEKLNPLYPCLPVLNKLTTPLASTTTSKDVLVRPALLVGPFLISWSHYCNNSLIIPQKLIGNALKATYSVHRIAEVYHPSFEQVCSILAEQIVWWNTCYRFDLHQRNAHAFLETILEKLNLTTCLYRISTVNSIWTEWLQIMKTHGQNGLVVEMKEDDSFYGPFLIKYKYTTNNNLNKIVPNIPLSKSNSGGIKNGVSTTTPSTPITPLPSKLIRVAFSTHMELDSFLNQLMEYDSDYTVHHHQDYNLLLLMDRLFWLNHLDNKSHSPFQPLHLKSNATPHSLSLVSQQQLQTKATFKLFSVLLDKKDICPFGSMDLF